MPVRRSYSKYRAVPTVVDGHRFASKAEARRYSELRLLEKAGKIRWLVLQPVFEFVVNEHLVAKYRADFSYYESLSAVREQIVVEDVKGVKTPVYKLKAKLMKALHGIEIREISA